MTTSATPLPSSQPALTPTTHAGSRRWLRLGLLALLLVGLWLTADATGLREQLTQEGIRDLVERAGPWGFVVFVAAFAIGQLAQLPGMAFVLAARVAWGPYLGFVVGYVGALTAVMTSFFVVRTVGGKQLGAIKRPWIARILARLETQPIRTIVILRTFAALSPPLNYALAMSNVRARDYFIGSALGLVAPIALWVFLSDVLLSFFSGVL